MKVDWSALAVRWAAAWFLFCAVLVFLAGAGAAQSFLDSSQDLLYRGARLGAWTGLGTTTLLVLPLCWSHPGRRVAAACEAVAFGVLTAAVLFWGAWIHPGAGWLPW